MWEIHQLHIRLIRARLLPEGASEVLIERKVLEEGQLGLPVPYTQRGSIGGLSKQQRAQLSASVAASPFKI